MIIALIIFLGIAFCIHYDSKKAEEWHDHKQIIIVIVAEETKLDDYCTKYKPSWMAKRDYLKEIMELNNMTRSTLHEGQILKFYYVVDNCNK